MHGQKNGVASEQDHSNNQRCSVETDIHFKRIPLLNIYAKISKMTVRPYSDRTCVFLACHWQIVSAVARRLKQTPGSSLPICFALTCTYRRIACNVGLYTVAHVDKSIVHAHLMIFFLNYLPITEGG